MSAAFERVSAFQFGFTDGIFACAAIDTDEIEQRRGKLPKEFLSEGGLGEVPINEDTVKTAVDTLNTLVSPARPPTVAFELQPCPNAKPSPPVSYCPATNSITVDMPGLVMMGTSLSRGSPLGMNADSLFGDYSALSVLISRHLLVIENDHGDLQLDGVDAGLRTACMTGAATTTLAKGVTLPKGGDFSLSGGDLDEAVSGLLTNGIAASDVNGEAAPSAFARIDAFRTGVLGDQDTCLQRWL